MFYAILQFPSQPTPPPSPCYVEQLYVSGALGNGKEESGVWAMKMIRRDWSHNYWEKTFETQTPFPRINQRK